MDVREKLVELVNQGMNTYYNSSEYTPLEEVIADSLISNGVTVQEWISVKDRLPEHGGVVLCFMKLGEQRILQWDDVSGWWLGYGHGDDWQKTDVTHWLPLLQPPKGE